MQIWTIQKRFEAFESKFKAIQSDSKHSNVNLNHSKHSYLNSNHSKGIPIIQIQILTFPKGFDAFESNF